MRFEERKRWKFGMRKRGEGVCQNGKAALYYENVSVGIPKRKGYY